MKPGHPLSGTHSMGEYAKATLTQQGRITPINSQNASSSKIFKQNEEDNFLGCIFVEVDRIKNSPHNQLGWKYPIQEYDFVALQRNADHTHMANSCLASFLGNQLHFALRWRSMRNHSILCIRVAIAG